MKTQARILVALIFLGCLLLSLPSLADEGDPPNRVARLSYMDGAVSFEPSGETNWSQASLNYPLTTGDRLWTDKDAKAELETGNIAMRMSAETDLTTTQLTDQLIQLGLAQGSLRIRAYDLRSGHEVEVDTPNAAITMVQAGNYRVDTYPDQNMTLVTVDSGELQVTGNGINQSVGSGQALQVTGTNPVDATWAAVPGKDGFDQWSAIRDQLYARSRSREYVSPEVPGYYDLDTYGSWSTVAEYGPVWYPSGLAVGWAPYRYGRWAWVEPWGWTWVDNAPWGFAPFHYGRWVQVGPRWGWLPGPIAVAPIYGPAFVAFVGGPGFSVGFGVGGVAAWFPLGPGEPFYPWYHHSDNYLRQVNITNVRNVTNITNITNITNVNNVHYRYQTAAVTAVRANTFGNSEPVARNIVKVSPQQLAHALVIPHPEIAPSPKAITAGAAATRPPVNRARPVVVQHAPVGPPTTAHNAPPANVRPGETVKPNTNQPRPPAANESHVPQPPSKAEVTTPHENPPGRPANEPANNEVRTPPPTVNTRPVEPRPENNPPPVVNNRPQGHPAVNTPPPSRPPLVSKNPPPAQERMPFEQRAPAMQEHPGRPLEPQQSSNLHAGKPAGPMQDLEFPPHAAPPPQRAAPPPASHPPAAHSAPPKH